MKREIIEERIINNLKKRPSWLLPIHDVLADEGCDMSLETVQKHLKKMTNERKITRETGERPDYGGHNWQDITKRPWVYFYRLHNAGIKY